MRRYFSRLWRLAIGRPQLGDTVEGQAVADAHRTLRDYQREVAEVQQDLADAKREGDEAAIEELQNSITLGFEMIEYQKQQAQELMAQYNKRHGVYR